MGDSLLSDVYHADRYGSLDDEAKSSATETREKIRAIFSGMHRIPASLRKAEIKRNVRGKPDKTASKPV
jgi:hypothetical protein